MEVYHLGERSTQRAAMPHIVAAACLPQRPFTQKTVSACHKHKLPGAQVTTGILIGATLSVLHCDLAALLGFMVFGLNFIPTVGLLAAVLLPLPLVLLAPPCPNVCWTEGDPGSSWPFDTEQQVRMRATILHDATPNPDDHNCSDNVSCCPRRPFSPIFAVL